MSGAEALAVISIVANIVALVNFSVKVYDRAQGFGDGVKDIPEEFREVRRVLPLIANTLQKTQDCIQAGEIDEETCKALRPVLHGCQTKVEDLGAIFNHVLPLDGASKWTRGWKAVASMGQNKKVKAIAANISKDIQVLTFYHASGVVTATQLTKALSAVAINTQPAKPLFMVRYQSDEDFIGREKIMIEINNQFTSRTRLALAGIGGVGKSRIAIEYCYQYKDIHPQAHVLWLHGGNRARFESAYEDVARTIKIPEVDQPRANVLQLVADWLSSPANGPWLLILDNADDAELWLGSGSKPSSTSDGKTPIPLINYLPQGAHGQLLITTRDLQLGKQLTGTRKKPIAVPPFETSEAKLLLRSKISEDDEMSDQDADELVEILEHLPLAITQAAAFLDQTEMTVAEYLQLLRAGEANAVDLLQIGLHDPGRDYEIQNAVFQTWRISFEQILKQNPRAGELLSLMAMLDRQSIFADLLRDAGESELKFREAIHKLKAFSLIAEETKSSIFSMHRIVQLSIQQWLGHQKTAQKWKEAALNAVSNRMPNSASCETWMAWRALVPHMRQVVCFKWDVDPAPLLQCATILSGLADYNAEQMHYEYAVHHLSEALQIRKTVLGQEDPKTLSNTVELAIVLSEWGRHEEADAMFKRAMRSYERLYGESDLLTLDTLKQMGTNYYVQGNFPAAETIFQRVLISSEETLGSAHPLAINAINHLGVLYAAQKKFGEAEDLFLKVLSGFDDTPGELEGYRLRTIYNLGYLYQEQGKLDEAESMYLQGLKAHTTISGPDHTSTLKLCYCLGSVYLAKGNLDAAEEYCLRALTGYEQYLELRYRTTRKVVAKLAHIYQCMGRIEEAKSMANRILEYRHNSDIGVIITCDGCNEDIAAVASYHYCFICREGDYDLCQGCFDAGASCLDDSHWLIKRESKSEVG